MKFSSSLKFNAVADWWDDYIAYDTLKRRIYQLEKQLYSQPRGRSTTSAAYRDDVEAGEPLLLHQDSDARFLPLLDRELAKICNFYKTQEKEMFQEFGEIEHYVQELDERGVHGYGSYYDEDDDDDDDDESISLPNLSPIGRRRRPLSESAPARNTQPQQKQPTPATATSCARDGGETTQPASPTDSASTPHARFSIPSLAHAHQSRVHTLPKRSRIRSRSVGALGAFTTTLQNLKDSFTSGGTHDDPRDGGAGDSGAVEISIWTSSSNYAYDTRLLLKRRMTKLYISLTNLRSYAELNYTGFRKILKKYDKVLQSYLSGSYLDKIRQSDPFREETKECLETTVNRLIDLYAKCVTLGEAGQARTQLKAHQREQIAWERDTVWRLMIGRERRGEVADIARLKGTSLLDEDATSDGLESGTVVGGGASLVTVREPEPALFGIPLPGTRTKEGKRKTFRVTKKMFWVALAVTCLVWLLKKKFIHLKGQDKGPANACFAVLVFCTILWASEAIPLFVTSLSVPFLLVVLRAIRNEEGKRLSAGNATKFIFSVIFSPTIMLLIGGFTISSALSKTNIDKLIITRVLNMAGTKPTRVILAFMGVSCFASMWISNVAAPTLCFTLIRPILRTLPRKSSFAPCLILAIALAANIGGQSSPISSPQNLIAIDYLDKTEPPLDWARWFAVALPVSAVSIILIWLLLIVSYRPSRLPPSVGGDILEEDPWDGSVRELEIKPIRPTKETFTPKQYWVSCVCLVTIALWCVAHEIEDYLGDMGIIAIMPIVAFFGTGVLKKDDFEHFAWSIVFLAMGGIALGKGVVASGLLEVMDVVIRDMLLNFSPYTVVLILAPVVLVTSTFISHTIASVLLVPIAKEVGKKLPGGHHSNLLIFITALICSAGMGMPVSGFPNQTAMLPCLTHSAPIRFAYHCPCHVSTWFSICLWMGSAAQEDELGEPYLTNVDFLKNGVPASIIATLAVVTIGFVLMKLIGL